MWRYQIKVGGVWETVKRKKWEHYKGPKRVITPSGRVVL